MAVQQRHMGRLLISHMSNAAPCPRAGTRPGTEDAPGSVCRSLILSGYWLRYHLLSSKTDSTIISQVPCGSQVLGAWEWVKGILLPLTEGREAPGPSSPQPWVLIPSNPTGQEDLSTGGSCPGGRCSPWALRAGHHLYSAHE